MSEILTELQNDLLTSSNIKIDTSLHCLSVYQCFKPQQLRHVSFTQPTILFVINGQKKVTLNDKNLLVNKGHLLLLPPETTLWIGNYPDAVLNQYLGLGFRFDQQALKHFRLIYGASLENWDLSPKWHTKAPDSIITTFRQLVNHDFRHSKNTQLIQHKQVELLLLLAQEGLVGNILLGEHPSWKQRVFQLISIDPSRAWQVKDICSRLGVSESSLRRKLQLEHTTFRELLEDVRLSHGLTLLLETIQPIGQIADAVGYQSQSRFGERFKLHYGMTPTELRRTLVA
jgi:AraC-like DNA-binding protein